MNISLPILILAGGFWVILLIGCVLFALLGSRYRREYVAEFNQNLALKEEVARMQSSLTQKESVVETKESDDLTESMSKDYIQELEEKLLAYEQAGAMQKPIQIEDASQASSVELDQLNEKYENLQTLWEGTNQELIRADSKIAELLGAKAALEKERNMLERQLSNFSSEMDASDTDTMREVIVNFTEESRELLNAIEDLSRKNAALEQKVADMESGGKGTAGAVVGLKRKLAEAQAVIEELRA